jgi:outer membrane biosynthesis protein TonB
MPLSNADNPTADQPVVAVPVVEPAVVPVPTPEPTPDPVPVKKAAKPKVVEPEKPVLAKAFTSGNAEVHNLVAEWEIASSNKDKDHLARVEAKLAALGYQI